MTVSEQRLERLGQALEQAAAHDLRPRGKGLRRPRRVIALAAILAVAVVTGAGFAAVEVWSGDEVAASLPAGTLWLAGTEPTCSVVTQDVEYHCVLAHAPGDEISDWKGTVEPTVGADKRVNGGCRSLRSDGRAWQCYIGEEAVKQRIISRGFLGEYAPTPGVG